MSHTHEEANTSVINKTKNPVWIRWIQEKLFQSVTNLWTNPIVFLFVKEEKFLDLEKKYFEHTISSFRYPSDKYPVLAFSSAPAPFPSTIKSWENQKFLRWNSRIVEKAKQFISSTLTRPFVGVHLRNDADWVIFPSIPFNLKLLQARVCEHVDPSQNRPIFASAQCLGENHHEGHLTKEMCAPSKATILEQVRSFALNYSSWLKR